MEERASYGPSIDLPGAAPRQLLPGAAQLAHLARASGEFALALRGGRAYGLRLAPAPAPAPRPAAPRVHPAHAAIVTGGTKASLHALKQALHKKQDRGGKSIL